MKQWNFAGLMPLQSLLVLMGLLALGACTSPQVRFYTLMQVPVEQPAHRTPARDQADIRVTSVTVPAPVDRNELVIRENDGELLVLASDWWGASLSEEIRSALVASLGFGGTDAPRVGLRLQITRFDSVPGEQAWLEARYRVTAQGGDGNRQLSCSVRLQTAASAGDGETVVALVMAQQENLRLLSKHIRSAAGGLAAGRGCPAV